MSSIRLLILGVMQRKQPVHGYEIRRELELWGADRWANIAYGSIYSALNKMAEEGLVRVVNTEQDHKPTARTEYALTDIGQQTFERLLREYWWEMKPIIDPFQVALSFMGCLQRDELLAALRYRAGQLRLILASIDQMIAGKMRAPDTPRYIAENVHLIAAHSEAELRWIEQAITKVENGDLP